MKKLVLGIISFLCWMALTWTLYLPSLLVGLVVSVFIALWFGDVFVERAKNFFQIRRLAYLLYYIPLFTYYCLLANFDVAYRVLHPALPIEPGIVKVKTTLTNTTAKVALANSITLTPGTLSVEMTDDGYLYIHWIKVRTTDVEEATEMIIRKFEKVLKEIFE